MEDLTLTTAISVTTYQVARLVLDWQGSTITIVVTDSNGDPKTFRYIGSTAVNLMTALNKMDLSVQSLHKRILNRLVSDGYLPGGSVTGTPD